MDRHQAFPTLNSWKIPVLAHIFEHVRGHRCRTRKLQSNYPAKINQPEMVIGSRTPALAKLYLLGVQTSGNCRYELPYAVSYSFWTSILPAISLATVNKR
jgi:hypothetical protein